MSIRKVFAQQKVLELYQQMSNIEYPIRPDSLLQFLPGDCRILTYQKMAEVSQCTIQDIESMCNSTSGATHYDINTDRYLILYNGSMNSGRILWTKCHEIGHIAMGHLQLLEAGLLSHMEEIAPYPQFEAEADYFTWNLLAPMPILREMSIQTEEEIRRIYGLSTQAAALHHNRYTKWCKSHIKTAWENNMLREFRNKYVK